MNSLRWFWPILAVTLAFFLQWACYSTRPARHLDLCVLDKTVPFRNWYEHRSPYWLLLHLNVMKGSGTNYALKRDYLGAYPPRAPFGFSASLPSAMWPKGSSSRLRKRRSTGGSTCP